MCIFVAYKDVRPSKLYYVCFVHFLRRSKTITYYVNVENIAAEAKSQKDNDDDENMNDEEINEGDIETSEELQNCFVAKCYTK